MHPGLEYYERITTNSRVTIPCLVERDATDPHQLSPGYRCTADGLALVAVVPFLSDERPMPAENRVRGEERADFLQPLASQHCQLLRTPHDDGRTSQWAIWSRLGQLLAERTHLSRRSK